MDKWNLAPQLSFVITEAPGTSSLRRGPTGTRGEYIPYSIPNCARGAPVQSL